MKLKRTDIIMVLLKIPMDVIMLCAAYTAIYYIRINESFMVSRPEFIFFLIKASLLYIAVNILLNVYSLKQRQTEDHVLLSLVIWFGITIAYFFFQKKLFFSRFILIGGMQLAFVTIKCGRVILKAIHRHLKAKGIGQNHILFIGHDKTIEHLEKHLIEDAHSKIVGYIGPHQDPTTQLPHLGTRENLKAICKEYKVDEVIQVSEHMAQSQEILDFCLQHQISYRFLPSILTMHTSNIEVENISGYPIISLKPTPLDGWGRVAKRLIDITGSLAGLILTSPIWLMAVIGVKLSSKGPAIISLERINQGKTFKIYKFRSMITGAHSMKDELIAKGANERGDGPLFKMQNDPRITKFGHFIRNTRIDELPQLFNVLKGEMSLVGPRPHETKEVAQYEDHHLKTLNIKPGMTGISQISGNSDLSFEEEVRLDLYYIENWNIIWDFKIIVKTIIFVLKPNKKNV